MKKLIKELKKILAKHPEATRQEQAEKSFIQSAIKIVEQDYSEIKSGKLKI